MKFSERDFNYIFETFFFLCISLWIIHIIVYYVLYYCIKYKCIYFLFPVCILSYFLETLI